MDRIKNIAFALSNDVAFICPTSLTVMGVGINTKPFIKVNWYSLSVSEKFDLIMEAFDGYQSNVPMPSNIKDYQQSILETWGFKNWKALYKATRYCNMTWNLDEKLIEFAPNIYWKEKDSLYGIKDWVKKLSTDSTAEEVIGTLEELLFKIPDFEQDFYSRR